MRALGILISDIQRTDANAYRIRDFGLVTRSEIESYLSNVNNPNAAVILLRDKYGPLINITVDDFTGQGSAMVIWKQNGEYHVGDANLVPMRRRPWKLETAMDSAFAPPNHFADSRD